MSDERIFVIVGASLAGAKAAETLRSEGFTGRVVLIGDEPVRPYERPPLSKGYLRGEAAADEAFVHDEGFYLEHDIELRLSTEVTGIDPTTNEITVDGEERIPYSAALLATGAAPRQLKVPGAHLSGVRYLRTMADADQLRASIATANRVVVIGGGWIGCEVAASARQMNAEVAMVEMAELPLERVLGPELGRFYRDVHADHGVEMHLGVGISELRGGSQVEEVVLADGRVLAADVVVAGVGVTPRTDLAQQAGLAIDNGVITNEWLATSVPNVFAAGDVANAWHPILDRRVRLEHWSSALNQGPVVARNMLGAKAAYERILYFFSDQYEIGMEYSGLAVEWDQVLFRGDPASREFIAFWLNSGRLVAGMNVNVWDVAESIATLVASPGHVDPTKLVDPDVELSSLARESA
ncbi:MAG: FAD-dependent oxidoreductase [Acidimicrobiales bacterium]|nr:FAD-dependent oxidoreductase [Acidimicrobiales bacterium]